MKSADRRAMRRRPLPRKALMEYEIRNEILPTYFQIGYFSLQQGIELGEPSKLYPSPISALHYHHCIELGICLSGSGETHIENRIYHFKRGDMQYIAPNTPHLSRANEGEQCEWIWIFIDPKKISPYPDKNGFERFWDIAGKGFNGVFAAHEHPLLFKRITDLYESSRDDKYSDIDHFLIAGQILIESARIGNIDKNQSRLQISKQIKPALVYIRENYTDPQAMSAERIAANCGLSISHFRNLFKNDIGMTLPQYINQTKLSAAVHLLETTDKPITQIATEAGFYEVAYFNRVFRKVYGMTPKDMRKYRNHETKS